MTLSDSKISLALNSEQRTISLSLLDRAVEVYDENSFKTGSTPTGSTFFTFFLADGSVLITPSAWIDIQLPVHRDAS